MIYLRAGSVIWPWFTIIIDNSWEMSFSPSVCLKRKKHGKGKLEIVNNSFRVGNKRSAQDERGILLRIKDLPVEHLNPSPISTCQVNTSRFLMLSRNFEIKVRLDEILQALITTYNDWCFTKWNTSMVVRNGEKTIDKQSCQLSTISYFWSKSCERALTLRWASLRVWSGHATSHARRVPRFLIPFPQ